MGHFHQELGALKEKLFKMSFSVEGAIAKAARSLFERNRDLAREVFQDEKAINQMEIEIDDLGHSLLALGQPMAADMRLLTAIFKINTDLERMGDHAINIAERALLMIEQPKLERVVDLPEMTALVQKMLRDALESFMNRDAVLAKDVLLRDDLVDQLNDGLSEQLQALMERDPLIVKAGMILVRVGHDLERIADLANNIAEDVIYLEQGREVRHHFEMPEPS